LIRFSMLRNCPVICQSKKAGLLQSAYMDEAKKQVTALIVSCGFTGKRIVPAQSILSIADGFILADKAMRFHKQKDICFWPMIRDTSGLLAGRVTDYAIDEDTLCVCAIEMIPGYLPFEYRKKIWVYEYSKANDAGNELVIPAGIGNEPIC